MTASPAATSPASPSATPAAGVLDERFGLYILGTVRGGILREAVIRSETSDAQVSSFDRQDWSFSSTSRAVSPDGRSIAYWAPVRNGAVLHVRSVTGGAARAVFTAAPDMDGGPFAWSSDGSGLVLAVGSGSEIPTGPPRRDELWTVDLRTGVTEKIATGTTLLPITWDRERNLVAAGATGPGGYLTGYSLFDLGQRPAKARGLAFSPFVIGRLGASRDARYVFLLTTAFVDAPSSLTWWPLAEPERRSSVAYNALAAQWRPGTTQIWWVSARTPGGCESAPCRGTELTSFDVATGDKTVLNGDFGARLVGFRVDGSAAITEAYGSTKTLVFVDISSGLTEATAIGGEFGEAVRLR